MTTCIVLLRGINVGGRNRLAMADLRGLLADLGATNVVTYLQSGQAVVDADPEGLAERVEEALAGRLGLAVRVLVITVDHLRAVVAGNPYPHRVATPKQLFVVFLDAAPEPATVAALGTRHGEDEFTVGDSVLYLSYSNQSHDSPLVPVLRKLGGLQTGRNWTTVTALLALAENR